MTTILAATSDWHVNDTVALCPPVVELDDGGTYHHSPEQAAIWDRWLTYWGTIGEKKAELGAGVVALVNGDAADLNKHSGNQLVVQTTGPISAMLYDVTEPARSIVDRWVIVRGTEAHTGGLGELEEGLAQGLGCRKNERGSWSHWYWQGEVEGVRIDATHHPATSSRRPWTRAQSAGRQAAITRSDYIEAGQRPPDLAFFGHFHYYANSGRTFAPEVIYLPSWKGIGAFGHRIGAGPNGQPVGGVVVTLDRGKYYWEPLLYRR